MVESYEVGLELSERIGLFLSAELSFEVEMDRGLDFGRTIGLAMSLLSVACTTWAVDVRDYDCGRGDWNPCISWSFNDRELEEVDYFLLRIQAKKVHMKEKDRVWWKPSSCGTFSMKSLHSILEPGDHLISARALAYGPPKVAFSV